MASFDVLRVSESLGLREIKKGLATSFNPFVVGSTPAGPTKKFKKRLMLESGAFLVFISGFFV